MQRNVELDLNSPQFQKDLLSLQQPEQLAILKTLKKISQMSWQQVYQDQGLKWEAIAQYNEEGNRMYTFRFSQKYRATALRVDNYLRVLTLNVDHDSAYH